MLFEKRIYYGDHSPLRLAASDFAFACGWISNKFYESGSYQPLSADTLLDALYHIERDQLTDIQNTAPIKLKLLKHGFDSLRETLSERGFPVSSEQNKHMRAQIDQLVESHSLRLR